MILLLMVAGALAGFWMGVRNQRYTRARADVRDTKGKLGKARKTRAEVRSEAVMGWLLLGALMVVLIAIAWQQ